MDAAASRTLSRRIAWLAERVAREPAGARGDWLTRFVVLRLLGLGYLMAFLTLAFQGPALLGPHGLLPVNGYLDAVAASLGSRGAGFCALPSVFWLGASDGALRAAGWVGAALSAVVLPATPTRSCSRSCARCRSRSSTSARRSTGSAGRSSSSRPGSSASSCARCWTRGRFLAGRRRPW